MSSSRLLPREVCTSSTGSTFFAQRELVFGDLGLRRDKGAGQQRPREVAEGDLDLLLGAHDLGFVFRFALVATLAVGYTVFGMGRHDDPSLRPIDAGLEGTLPFSYSAVSSPRYQTLPAPSWAYQSYVISTGCPFRLTTSWMTLAS